MFDDSAGETIVIMAACIVWLTQQAVGAVKGNGKKLGYKIDELKKSVTENHELYRKEMSELRKSIKELIELLKTQRGAP